MGGGERERERERERESDRERVIETEIVSVCSSRSGLFTLLVLRCKVVWPSPLLSQL